MSDTPRHTAAPVHVPPEPEPPLRAALRAAGHIPLGCGNAVIVATQEANGGRVIHSQGGDRALFDLARAVMDHARSEHRGYPRGGVAAWIWCDIDGTGDRWRLALASAAQDADTLRFPFDDFEDDCANYADCPTVMIGRPAPPPRVDRPADGAAFLAMHQALRRVADLWGPCPAGDDAAPIFTAGAAFGTLADLRAVEHALALAGRPPVSEAPTAGARGDDEATAEERFVCAAAALLHPLRVLEQALSEWLGDPTSEQRLAAALRLRLRELIEAHASPLEPAMSAADQDEALGND